MKRSTNYSTSSGILKDDNTTISPHAAKSVLDRFSRWLLAMALCLMAGSVFGVTPTNTWFGAGSDFYWNTAANWDAAGVPIPTSLVVFTNYGATGLPGTNGSGAMGTPNIAITNDTTIGQLWFVNTNSVVTGPQQYHTIGLDPGVTLTVSNVPTGMPAPANIIQACSQGGFTTQFGVQNGNVDQVDYATIQGGAGSRLRVICTNAITIYGQANIFVSQGSAGLAAYPTIDPCNSYLDLSGLDYFEGYLNHICVAADPQSAPLGYYFHRATGTMYLAKTNKIVLWSVGNAPSGGPSTGTPGIMLGWTAQNNAGGLGRVGALYLGITNEIYCTTGIGVGGRNSSGWMGFNPSNAPGISVAYFRNRAGLNPGTGRQNLWAIGHRMNVNAGGAGIQGILDLSGGKVDALVDQLQIGRANSLATWGSVYLGAGTVDANSLQLGYQETSGGPAGQGTLIVSNSAVLKINTSAVLGFITGSPVAGQQYFGILSILDGGTVAANAAPFTCGVGSSNSISVVNGSSLAVASIGTAAAPLTYLTVWNNGTLTVDMGLNGNPSSAPIQVSTLDSAGTNTINMLGYALSVGQFPLIKYTTWLHDDSQATCTNFVLGSVSPGKTMYITNNLANSSIDVVITSSDIGLLTWDGQTNGAPIGNWDISVTPNWKGGNYYSQLSVVGDPVVFDDTASGTTTVTLMADLSPVSVLVNNSAKSYNFDGNGVIKFGPFVKDGPGLLTLANSNSSSSAFTISNGTVRLSGADNRLSLSAPVTLANVATAGLDLNNLNQTLSSLNGGGTAGGNVALGSGTLQISGSGTYSGEINGSGRLIKITGGTETLAGASTYSGGTIVSNGTLAVANATGSGVGSGPVFVAGGTLQLGDGVNNGSITAATITNNSALTLKPGSSMVFTKVVYGTGTLAKVDQGASTPAVQITNANFYTGQSSVNNGLLQINHPKALGTGLIALGNQLTTADELDLSGNITISNNISIPGRTGGVIPSPAALVSINDPFTGAPGTNTLWGTNTLTGSTCFSIGAASGNGLIVAGPITNSSASTGLRFFLRGAGYGELRSGLAGSISLEYSEPGGGGTWLIAGTNTYTGATLIGNNGTLIVNGAIKGSSYLRVGAGAVLAGHGLISCSVTNLGTVSPGGDGVLGTLTVSNLFFSDALTSLNFDVGPTGNDQIRGMSTYYTGGSLNVSVLAPITGNCIFKLFDAVTYNSTFAYDSVNLPDISPLGWDTSYLAVDGTLHVTNGPAITPAITGITTGPGGTIKISGTGTLVAPFTVLITTNITTPLANWQVIGTGTFSNGSFNFTDTSATNSPRRFYQVTTPVP
jgi:fibronectin-binding autotransporter adhesin